MKLAASLGRIFIASAVAFGSFDCSRLDITNPAQASLRPFSDKVDQIGGTRLCDAGDPGIGPDNTSPWYSVAYVLPDTPDFNYDIVALAQKYGYVMAPPPDTSGGGGDDPTMSITSRRGGDTLVLAISRSPVDCGLAGYLRERDVGNGRVILNLELRSPPRR